MQEMQETQVGSLGSGDTLEEAMATHSSILAWESHGGGAWQAKVRGVTKESDRQSNQTTTNQPGWIDLCSASNCYIRNRGQQVECVD